MAFTANIDAVSSPIKLAGGGQIEAVRITITATECATASEKEIVWADYAASKWLGGSDRLYLREFRCHRISGDSATAQGLLGTAAGCAGLDMVAELDAVADDMDNSFMGNPPSFAAGTSIFFRPQPASGSNTVVHAELLISAVWGA